MCCMANGLLILYNYYLDEFYFSMFSLTKEFWEFLRVRKKWWLLPIVFFLVAIGGLLVATQGSVVAPFIYTLF